MEGFSGSSIPSSSALPCPSELGLFSKPRTGQAIDFKLAALKHKYARLQDQKNQQRKEGEKSELSLDLLLSTLEKKHSRCSLVEAKECYVTSPAKPKTKGWQKE